MNQRRFPVNPVLIVDDEPEILKGFDLTLRSEGISHTLLEEKAENVMPLLAENSVEVILLDLSMPKISGDRLLEMINKEYPQIPVIVITGTREVETAVHCMKKNAFDYMVKPIDESRLTSGVKRAIEIKRLYDENQLLKEPDLTLPGKIPAAFSSIITANKKMKNLFRYAASIAKSPLPLLITGETGVGKELMAQAVHKSSALSGDFVPVNVAGIDDATFSDTLFGHVKGAFTGANTLRKGLVEKAAGGTLFLDEIGDLKEDSQIKLLRLLQENEYFTLGSDLPKRMDTRVVAATNRNLKEAKNRGRFRKDLYYRLSTHHIDLPPLRKRLEDLPLLINAFLDKAAGVYQREKPGFSSELVTLLTNYNFPGNVRELEGMVFDAVSGSESHRLSMTAFKRHMNRNRPEPSNQPNFSAFTDASVFALLPRLPTMAEAQLLLIKNALERTGNNKSMAADLLGISRQRLARLLKTDV
ncbi:MAG: sigma-54 dependent transcriptional regulator [Desulfobacteraceae bacterium]